MDDYLQRVNSGAFYLLVAVVLRFIPHQPTAESIALIRERAKKFDLETEVITATSHAR